MIELLYFYNFIWAIEKKLFFFLYIKKFNLINFYNKYIKFIFLIHISSKFKINFNFNILNYLHYIWKNLLWKYIVSKNK